MCLSKLQPIGRGIASILLGLQKTWRGFPLKCRLCCPKQKQIIEEDINPPLDVSYVDFAYVAYYNHSNAPHTDSIYYRAISPSGIAEPTLLSNTSQTVSYSENTTLFQTANIFNHGYYGGGDIATYNNIVLGLTFRSTSPRQAAHIFKEGLHFTENTTRQSVLEEGVLDSHVLILGYAVDLVNKTTNINYVDPITGYAVEGSITITREYYNSNEVAIDLNITLYAPYAYLSHETGQEG